MENQSESNSKVAQNHRGFQNSFGWLIFFLCLAMGLSVLTPLASTMEERPRTVVVWDFDNNSFMDVQKFDFLKKVLPEILLNYLSNVRTLKLVERVHLKEAMEELKIGSGELASEEGRLKLGKILGAREMVFGSIMGIGEQIRVDIRLVEVETTKTTYAEQFMANSKTLLKDMEKLSETFAKQLGAQQTDVIGKRKLKGDFTIWKKYDEGIAFMDAKDYPQAINVFKSILEKDETFFLAEKQIQFAIERMARQ